MITPRDAFTSIYVKNTIYVVAGRDNNINYITKCEKYDIINDKWT